MVGFTIVWDTENDSMQKIYKIFTDHVKPTYNKNEACKTLTLISDVLYTINIHGCYAQITLNLML